MKSRVLQLFAVILALTACLIAPSVQAQKPGEKPIAGGRLKGVGPIKPIYQSDIMKDIGEVKAKVDKMAEQVKAVKINPEPDSVEQMFKGSISLARHNADIVEIRDEFTRCTAAMENKIREKTDSGTATAEDKAQFEKCIGHCKKILAALDGLHYNASMLISATRQQYVLDGWAKHKKTMEEVQALVKDCPDMMKTTMACCEMPKGSEPKK